ncbi:CHASE2 domain-containing protein [Silvimonas amylolytica]|uniref:Adenylate/guanylate cyclase domain-containing protein n=1 Tax=Silvimonas amylolytica TaxID=449663 RepID=A0ABQ2PSH8_9NEIS|nr:adenylate/guanylate cyclase domain-containing protein [Silvimonas amylolytica]GGP28208.1 adenylate/guanylate cyclase domain-containing protein [Silvimonas amylolytica]
MGLLCFVLLAAHALNALRLPALDRLDAYLYDTRVRLAAATGPDPRVAIIDIDEKSLAALGRWPWRRDVMARLVDQVFVRDHAKALGFDVVFAETDDSTGLATLRRLASGELSDVPEFASTLNRIAPRLDTDSRFATSLAQRNTVLGFYFSQDPKAVSAGVLPPPALDAGDLAPVATAIPQAMHYGANLAQLQTAAAAGGHFVPTVDADGVIRRVPLLVQINGQYYPALSLALVQQALGNAAISPVIEAGAGVPQLEALRVGKTRLAVDQYGRATVPYRGPARSFDYFSAIDVLNGNIPAATLTNRIILLGATTPGLNDLRVTPVGEAYPGVEIHANLISAMLDGALPSRPGYLLGAEVVLLALLTPLLVWLLARRPPLQSSLLVLVLLAVLAAGDVWLWRVQHVDFPFASTLTLVLLLYVLNMAWGYIFVTRRQSQLRELFGQYVVPELVDRMSADPGRYTMAGQSRELSILFTDVRRFTSISESMPPAELTQFMNAFLTEISTVIRSGQPGTIDKYIGDCVMAFWGAPIPDPLHAHNAVLAALNIVAAIRPLNQRFAMRNWPQVVVGVGVHTGIATVGDMGSSYRLTYTAMGDAVNLSSRIESLTKFYGVPVLVSAATHDAAPGFVYREVDRVRVKGREDAVTLYEPLSAVADPVLQAQADGFAGVLIAYRARQWAEALRQLQILRTQADCGLYAVWQTRLETMQASPPPDHWDGVHAFESK